MPTLSSFYGILIYIYKEMGGKHHVPHFHALYNEHEAVFDLEGTLIEGSLPVKKKKLVEAWCAIHEDEIKSSYRAWQENGEMIKIEGLR